MGVIRSSYEKAMERFQDVKANKKALTRKEIVDEGKALSARYLNSEEIKLQEALDRYDDEKADWLKYGMGETLIGRISLPANTAAGDIIPKLITLAMALSPQPAIVEQLLNQFKGLCDQYGSERLKLGEQLESQMQQIMQQQGAALQNEQQRAAFQQKMVKSMQEQMQRIEEQFQPAVDKVKANLRQLLGTWLEK